MDDTASSIAVIALGALILLASLTADMIGLGDQLGFGPKQIIGTVIGIILLAMGVDFLRAARREANWPNEARH